MGNEEIIIAIRALDEVTKVLSRVKKEIKTAQTGMTQDALRGAKTRENAFAKEQNKAVADMRRRAVFQERMNRQRATEATRAARAQKEANRQKAVEIRQQEKLNQLHTQQSRFQKMRTAAHKMEARAAYHRGQVFTYALTAAAVAAPMMTYAKRERIGAAAQMARNWTDEQTKVFTDAIDKYSKKYGIAYEEVGRAALPGARMGLMGEELDKFVEKMAQVRRALDEVPLERSAEGVAKTMRMMNMSVDEASGIFDAINWMTQKRGASATRLFEMIGRGGGTLSALGGRANLENVMPLLGEAELVTRTGRLGISVLDQFIQGLVMKAETGDKGAKAALASFAEDPAAYFMELSKRFEEVGPNKKMEQIYQLWGKESGISRFVALMTDPEQAKMFVKRQKEQKEAKDRLDSIQIEADAARKYLFAQIEIMQAKTGSAMAAVGQAQAGTGIGIVDVIGGFMDMVASLAREFPALVNVALGAIATVLIVGLGNAVVQLVASAFVAGLAKIAAGAAIVAAGAVASIPAIATAIVVGIIGALFSAMYDNKDKLTGHIRSPYADEILTPWSRQAARPRPVPFYEYKETPEFLKQAMWFMPNTGSSVDVRTTVEAPPGYNVSTTTSEKPKQKVGKSPLIFPDL
jgi:hypothetical protein